MSWLSIDEFLSIHLDNQNMFFPSADSLQESRYLDTLFDDTPILHYCFQYPQYEYLFTP